MPSKVLFFHHPYNRPRFEQDFLDRIAELSDFELQAANLDLLAEGKLSADPRALNAYDAVIVFVAFNRLRQAPPLHWGSYAGLKVMFEHDAIQNYSDLFDPFLKGAWPPVFRRHRFDLMITSGRVIQERLADDGVDAEWAPKAFEPARFMDLATEREGIITYGSLYRCRAIAERALVEANLPLTRIPMTPYSDLGATLARHLACLAISSDLLVPLDQREQLSGLPARTIPIKPGLEPMAKFFEGAGAGCCPIADAMADLTALGFRDGENVITFSTHDELIEKASWWLSQPEALQQLGRAAAAHAHAEHTWAHRAKLLHEILERRLSS